MAYQISPHRAKMIHQHTGLTVKQIRDMPIEEVQAAIEKKVGRRLRVRAEPRRRISEEEIDRRLAKV